MRSDGVARGAGLLEWPMPRKFIWLWTCFVVLWWWSASVNAAAGGAGSGIAVIAFAVAGRMAGILVEAAWYVVVWRSLGRRLPLVWFTVWLVTLTLFDLMGDALRPIAGRHPALAPWLAPIAGLGLLPAAHQWSAGLRVVFGSLGLFTLARIACAAALQARATGASRFLALALTAGTWLATRVALWWTADLVRGMSPMP
jgi:hypothetical protein